MSYITSNQGRPIQGVSQQPEKTRLPGQCTLSENMRPDVVRGLINRQGTETSTRLTTALLSNDTLWYHYERGTGEEYFISIEPGTGYIKAWSPNGIQHTINTQSGTYDYIKSDNPKKDLRLMTIGDYTFIINTLVNVVPSTTLTTAISHKSIVYCQFIDYAQRVQIFINNNLVATYCAPDGSNSQHKFLIPPEYVIEKLVDSLYGGSGGDPVGAVDGTVYGWTGTDISAEYDISVDGNIIILERKDHEDYTISVNDDVDNDNTVAIKGKIKNTTLLPGSAPEGFIIEVDPPGATKSDNANFFLKAENSGGDHVTWKETIAPGISVGADLATMPHVLVRESITNDVATFSLRKGEWSDREVGNEDTNPQPTFINVDNPSCINSIGLFQNRLFFTSGESVILSRSADFFNFYRETAQASLDTDPIDIFADVPQINYLKNNIMFDGDLVFFSDQGQFILDGSKAVSPSNAVLRQVTTYEAQMSVDPVASGDAIFFAFSYGEYTGIREFFTDSVTDTKKARPITDHVKQYIKGEPDIMASSTNLNILVVKTVDANNVLYVYDWLWQDTEKVQSSWGKFVFPETDTILYFEFVEELLWLVMLRDNNSIWLEKIDMGDPPDVVTEYPIRLDRKTNQGFFKDGSGDFWVMTDPLPDVPVEDIVIIRKTGAYEAEIGTPINFVRDGSALKTYEDIGADTVLTVVGRKYSCKYTPTNPVALDENGYALNLDRLTVGAFYMNYNTTGDISATVAYDNGSVITSVKTSNFNNRTLGGFENLIGFAPLVEGQHRVPIRQKSDRYTLTFSTDSHLPLEVRDFEFDGNLNRRGKRI